MWRTTLAMMVAVMNAWALQAQALIPPQSMSAPRPMSPGLQPGAALSTLKEPDNPGSRVQPGAASQPAVGAASAAPAKAPLKEDLRTFDRRQLELRLVDQHWQLLAGKTMLKDCGSSESAGRDALQLIHDLGLTHYGSIGKPVPILEYWLADGQAPQGSVSRLSTLSFDSASLHVEQVQGQWYLRDARQMLFNFGGHADDAHMALEVLRRYEFNQIAFVGFPMPVMMVLLAHPDQRTSGSPSVSVGPESPLQRAARLQTRQLAAPTSALVEPGIAGERLPFDWRMAELRGDHNQWKLMIGSYCLADFGCHEWEAREGLRVLQHYRFTEECRLGQSEPSFRYFLVNGQAPCGLPFGLRTTAFRPEALTVRQVNGAWAIYDNNRPLFQFGDRAEEARAALQVIQRHQFDHLCQVGDGQPPALSFLVRER